MIHNQASKMFKIAIKSIKSAGVVLSVFHFSIEFGWETPRHDFENTVRILQDIQTNNFMQGRKSRNADERKDSLY